MAYRYIDYDHPTVGVARITLRRPDRLNAINADTSDELLDAEELAATDPAVVVLIYRGSGRAFCAGRDLKDMDHERDRRLEWMDRGGWSRPWSFSKLTIAQVHGYAIGGGALLATSCDITFASTDASFGYPEARLGMGDLIGHPWLQLVGAKRAKSLLISGRTITAAEAVQMGLATQECRVDELEQLVTAHARLVVECEQERRGSVSKFKQELNHPPDWQPTTGPMS
jgi:enoyl-CoA hydratase/carnithine racemase